jgi:arsenate reductase
VSDVDPGWVDVVITLCADEVCPVFLGGATRLHWGLPDPAAVTDPAERLESFRRTRDTLMMRIRSLFV